MIQRMLVRYLRRKGWIVFWLDEPAQYCSAYNYGDGKLNLVCWLHEYKRNKENKNEN